MQAIAPSWDVMAAYGLQWALIVVGPQPHRQPPWQLVLLVWRQGTRRLHTILAATPTDSVVHCWLYRRWPRAVFRLWRMAGALMWCAMAREGNNAEPLYLTLECEALQGGAVADVADTGEVAGVEGEARRISGDNMAWHACGTMIPRDWPAGPAALSRGSLGFP